MRPQAKKFVSPLLFLALVVISIVVVSQLIGRNDSSMLTIDNDEPPITDDENNDDDGLRTVGDDDDESIVNTTIIYNDLSTALPTYLPTMMPTANDATNAPSVISPIEQTSSSPTLRPIASFPLGASSRLPSQSPNQPMKGTTSPTMSPLNTPSPKLTTTKTSQPISKSPGTNKSTSSPSTMPSSMSPSKSPMNVEPNADLISQPDDDSTTYHVTNGCVREDDASSLTTCIAAEHTSKIAVNCCSGSQSSNNLTCRRKGCFKTTSYNAAKFHCEKEGMRLCTSTELTSGACCNKGCGFNRQLSWAADVCEPTVSPTNSPTGEPTSSPTHLPTHSPSRSPTKEPTLSPTKLPTQSPTTQAGTLVNFSSGDRSVGGEEAITIGIMFEVQALRDLAITSLSTFTESENKIWSEVWIREGRYQGQTADGAGWQRVYFKRSQQYGNSAPLDIVFDDKQVFIPEGQIMSFYLVSPGKFLSDQGNVEGDVIAEDNSLRLYTGAAIDNGRWEEGCTEDRDCIHPARIFNGAISYATATMPPTSQPTPDPFERQPSGLTLREEQWLDGHNVRRKKWHKMYGKKYKPLQWSEGLKDMAQAYADELASDCGPTVHDSYADREGYGENLASNTGRDDGAGSWGELKPVELVMSRFVERESTWEPPANGHFTQVLWYATTHVGCADSKGEKPNGSTVCRYQVCRYARAGNCGVQSFNDGSEEWWLKAVMQDSSNCKPYCPPEGC
mmetsp:Transcript_11740/g.23615  ORF Transcript_11740/g.23615 Transcript_11740/m.23615 type:complete len:731 (-) Transcript_11740:139-2331(-)